MPEIWAVAMFFAAIGAVLVGYHVAFTLAGLGTLFGLVGAAFGVFEAGIFAGLPSRYFGIMVDEILVAVPLFIFMGVTLERSGVAEALLTTMGRLFGRMPGGLGIAVVLVGALLAASTGIVGATVVTMGLISLPAMLRARYDGGLASGLICASGTLGQIIPPSTILILVAILLQSANQRAQMALGLAAPEPVSVGQLFAGAILPGLVLVGLYLAWIGVLAVWRPLRCPSASDQGLTRPSLAQAVGAIMPPMLLIAGVLGSILVGLATPTESAAVGAVGALALTVLRSRFTVALLKSVLTSTLTMSSMVFTIFLGASVFSLVFRGFDGDIFVSELLASVGGGAHIALLVVLTATFFLGFFLDTLELIFIVIPITAPALIQLGVDPVLLGVLLGLVLQTSFLTPPFGFALFYLRGVAPPEVSTSVIYRGVMPFVGLQLAALGLVWWQPDIVLALPDALFGQEVVGSGPPDGGGTEGELNELFQ
ncbi:MAG: TRAP transporter large permease [Pseudomonadota bacterium]